MDDFITVKLKKTLEYEDKTYNEIKIDLDKITGEVIEKAEKALVLERTYIANSNTSPTFAARVATVAGGYPAGLFNKLPAYAYMAITNGVINFLLSSDEAEEATEIK